MLRKITDGVDHIYLACGPTDFRKQIPGLTALIQSRFQLDPYTSASLFLFCNRRRTAIKALRYDANGFLLVSKVLMDQQKFSWPKSKPRGFQCLSPAKKYKLYKSSINKSLHFAQRRLSSSTRVQVQRVTAQLNLSRE